MKRFIFPLILTSLLLTFWSCTPKIEVPEPDSGNADFSRFVVMGGRQMAGYRSGGLHQEGQQSSVGAILAAQFGQAQEVQFQQALMPANTSVGLNSKPWVSIYQTSSVLGYRTDCEGTVSLGPVSDTLGQNEALTALNNVTVTGAINDLAIPFATTNHLLHAPGTNATAYRQRISMGSHPGPLDHLNAADPTFFALWPGMEDVYQTLMRGYTNPSIPDQATFRLQLDSLLQALTANGAGGAIANIPRFSHLPYFTTIPALGAEMTQGTADSLNDIFSQAGIDTNFVRWHEGPNGFLINDSTAGPGIRHLTEDENILLIANLDSMRCYLQGIIFTVVPDGYVLDAPEIALANQVIDQYNSVIAQKADEYDLALVDMNAYYSQLHEGQLVDGVDFSTEFVSGGFFSLDGYTATGKGSVLIANQFISAINLHYGATIPPAQLNDYDGLLFP